MAKKRNKKEEYKNEIDDVFEDVIEFGDNEVNDLPNIDVDEIKKELMNYVEERVDTEVDKKVKNIKVDSDSIDSSSLKEELSIYMKGKIDSEVSDVIERANKKIIKHKNGIIIKRDIFIVILLLVCFFLGYNLYSISNITIDIKKEEKNTPVKKVVTKKDVEEKKEEKEENTEFDNLVKKYEYLVKMISVNEDSTYLKDFYEGKISDEIRLYISFDNLDSSVVNNDDDTIFVDENVLKEKYEELFDTNYEAMSFEYNDVHFKYLTSKEMYFGAGKLRKNGTAIVKKIVDIKEDDDLVITTIEGIVSKGKLYSIIDNKEICDYDGDNLENYVEELVKLEYTFKNVDGNYKFSEINIK